MFSGSWWNRQWVCCVSLGIKRQVHQLSWAALSTVMRIGAISLWGLGNFPLAILYLLDLHIGTVQIFFPSSLSMVLLPSEATSFPIPIKIYLFIFFLALLISFFFLLTLTKHLYLVLQTGFPHQRLLSFSWLYWKAINSVSGLLSSLSESLELMTL